LCKFVNISTICKVLNPVPYAQFWHPFHQNAFGSWPLRGPDEGAYPLAGFGERWGKGSIGMRRDVKVEGEGEE